MPASTGLFRVVAIVNATARNDCRWNARCIHDACLDQIGVLDSKLVETIAR